MESNLNNELLSLEEAAEMLCVSKSTLYRMLERSEIVGHKVGRQWRFIRADLQAYLTRDSHAVLLASVDSAEVDELMPALAEASQRLNVPLPVLTADTTAAESLQEFVNQLLKLAISARASDIHLAPGRDSVLMQLRVDGVLQQLGIIPTTAYSAVVGQIKQMASMSIDERALPQDGRILFSEHQRSFDLRISSLPTIFGESVVMRLLDQQAASLRLEQLPFNVADLQRLQRWLSTSNGLIICTGPTGSGKTTTLYACLQQITGPQKNTMTIEDPVEYLLPNTRQTQVNRRVGLTFPMAMRAFLRHDPDVILVGELRDKETAEVTLAAALTGHLVLTTLNPASAAAAARRLVEMGMEPFVISGAMLGIVAQRLGRKICQQCKTPEIIPSAILTGIRERAAQGGVQVPPAAQFFNGIGCDACGGSGFRGRTALFELLEFTHEVRESFLNGESAEEIMRVAVSQGMTSIFADGIRKALAGEITVNEVLRITS